MPVQRALQGQRRSAPHRHHWSAAAAHKTTAGALRRLPRSPHQRRCCGTAHRDLLVEGGPAAPRVKLGLALVQGRAAPGALRGGERRVWRSEPDASPGWCCTLLDPTAHHVRPLLVVLVVLASPRPLGALLAQDAKLQGAQAAQARTPLLRVLTSGLARTTICGVLSSSNSAPPLASARSSRRCRACSCAAGGRHQAGRHQVKWHSVRSDSQHHNASASLALRLEESIREVAARTCPGWSWPSCSSRVRLVARVCSLVCCVPCRMYAYVRATNLRALLCSDVAWRGLLPRSLLIHHQLTSAAPSWQATSYLRECSEAARHARQACGLSRLCHGPTCQSERDEPHARVHPHTGAPASLSHACNCSCSPCASSSTRHGTRSTLYASSSGAHQWSASAQI